MILLQTIVFFFALLYTYKSAYLWIDACMLYFKHSTNERNGMFLVKYDYITIFLWSLLFYLLKS